MGYGLFPVLFAMNFSWEKVYPSNENMNQEDILERKLSYVFAAAVLLLALVIGLAGVDSL